MTGLVNTASVSITLYIPRTWSCIIRQGRTGSFIYFTNSLLILSILSSMTAITLWQHYLCAAWPVLKNLWACGS